MKILEMIGLAVVAALTVLGGIGTGLTEHGLRLRGAYGVDSTKLNDDGEQQ
jgi:hypothetical protein